MDQHSSQEDRPSFATFWQKNKSESADNRLTFVQSDPGQLEKQAPRGKKKPPEESTDGQSAADRRRAQVRKAQTQHRRRKADYVRQLEADAAGIRGRIEDAERARRALRAANLDLRARLSGPSSSSASQFAQQQGGSSSSSSNAGFYADPSYSSNPVWTAEEVAMMHHGFGGGLGGTDLGAAPDADFCEMLNAPGATYLDCGSPAYGAGSSGASSAMQGSPGFVDSGTNTPYPILSDGNGRTDSHHMMDFMFQ